MDHRPIESFVSTGIAEADVGAVGSSAFLFSDFLFSGFMTIPEYYGGTSEEWAKRLESP